MDIRRILCPIDLSDASTHALEQAALLAGWYSARVTVLHVQSLSPLVGDLALSGIPGEVMPDPWDTTELRNRVVTWCHNAITDHSRLDVTVVSGQPVAAILEHAATWPADVIVMGTHGTSGFQHLVLGSVTEKVLRKAACPVLTVPPRAHATSTLPFKKLLCAVDFSACSLRAVEYAASLAKESGAEVMLLSVLEWPWAEPPPPRLEGLPPQQAFALAEYRRYAETTAAARLETVASSAIPGGTVTTTRVLSGKPYAQLLAAARDEGADLIVMGVRGRGALELGLFGSTANQVVRRATCPVLTIGG